MARESRPTGRANKVDIKDEQQLYQLCRTYKEVGVVQLVLSPVSPYAASSVPPFLTHRDPLPMSPTQH